MEWSDELATGDPVVDEHHRTLHQVLFELEAGPDDRAHVMHTLEFLSQYVLMHFSTEEDLMHRSGFPQKLAHAHEVEHRRLADLTRQRVMEFREGRLNSTGPLIEFLRSWLSVHIHEWDRVLIQHVQGRGHFAQVPQELTPPVRRGAPSGDAD